VGTIDPNGHTKTGGEGSLGEKGFTMVERETYGGGLWGVGSSRGRHISRWEVLKNTKNNRGEGRSQLGKGRRAFLGSTSTVKF